MDKKTNNMFTILKDAFFGEEYEKHLKLMNSILLCASLKSFRALNIDLQAAEVESIFRTANYKAEDKELIFQARAVQIFTQAKAVTAESVFI